MDDEMNILWPEQKVTVEDSTVTLHELTFGQSARLSGYWRPVADAVLSEVPLAGDDADSYGAAVYDVAERYASHLIELILATARDSDGQPLDREWLEGLAPDNGMLLAVVWLSVHLRFFGASRVGRKGEPQKGSGSA